MDRHLEALKLQIAPLERFVDLFARSLAQPKLRQINSDRGFRYDAPDVRHFCLLKAVRVVSALNAAVELARAGYTQEIGVLMRTLVECTTHIEFVLDPDESEKHRSDVEKYVRAFFEDSHRDPTAGIKKAQVQQGIVHSLLGRTLDKITQQQAEVEGRRPAAELFSNVYRIFSNYVHAKYPEAMDLYGGKPGRFHLCGMRGTPKDSENVETIQTFIDTASNTVGLMILRLNLLTLVETDPVVAAWCMERKRAYTR